MNASTSAATARRQKPATHTARPPASSRAAGIATAPDEEEAAARYVALRRQWQCYVSGFADYMERSMEEVEPPDGGAAEGLGGGSFEETE